MQSHQESSPISVEHIKFVEEARHKRGLESEESALRLLERKFPMMARVEPSRAVGECDAIAFTSFGLVLLEVKRYGGSIERVTATGRWRIQRGARTDEIENPLTQLRRRGDALRREVNQHPAWRDLKTLWSDVFGVGSEGIPVHEVLCFGPSTKFNDETTENDRVLVCSTRTLAVKLSSYLSDKQNLPGFAAYARHLGNLWPQDGRLTVRGRKGFVRCRPSPLENSCASFFGATLIKQGRKAGVLQVDYATTEKRVRVESNVIVFRGHVNGAWGSFSVPSTKINQWKSGG